MPEPQEEQKTKTLPVKTVDKFYNPPKCPTCKGLDVAFVTEYHKSILFRILSGVSFAVFLVFSVLMTFGFLSNLFTNPEKALDLLDDGRLDFLLILLAMHAIFKLCLWFAERRTHVKCICKHCSATWLLD